MKTKVTYIISGVNKAVAFEWIAELLNKDSFNLNFILLNNGDSILESYLKENHIKVKRIPYKNKFDIPKAIVSLTCFLIKNKPNIIHAHLFDASLVGLSAAWLCGIKKRIYTRHHSAFHHDHFPKAVKYDKLCNALASHIVSVSKNVSLILNQKEGVPLSKIILIHHGFKLELFKNIPDSDITMLKQKYETEGHYPVVGVIARFTEWKGIQYIIPAFKNILVEYPKAKLVLANASGDYQAQIETLLQDIPRNNFIEIVFEENHFALYKLFDLFVHTPIEEDVEAFGQVYVEALAASIPSVFTLSGIATDFVKHGENALVVNYCDSQDILAAMRELLRNKELMKKIASKGYADVHSLFPVSKMIRELENLYSH